MRHRSRAGDAEQKAVLVGFAEGDELGGRRPSLLVLLKAMNSARLFIGKALDTKMPTG